MRMFDRRDRLAIVAGDTKLVANAGKKITQPDRQPALSSPPSDFGAHAIVSRAGDAPS